MAAQAEGMAAVPCVFVEHLTETEARVYSGGQQTGRVGGVDDNLWKLEIGELAALDFDIGIIGFAESDFDGIGRPEKEPVAKPKPYEKHHVLITCDAAKSPEIMEIINRAARYRGS